jgi:hypothetical protein
MLRILLATVLGAVVIFVWNMAAWMLPVPIHEGTLHYLKDEAAVKKALVDQNLDEGYYVIPGMAEEDENTTAEQKQANWEACLEAHRQGPVVSIIYAHGQDPMSPEIMAKGFGIDLAAALIAALLLSGATCCKNYFARVGFVLGLGVFAAIVSYVALWNWMKFPPDFILGMILDMVIGWTLVGLVMAAVIRPKSQ